MSQLPSGVSDQPKVVDSLFVELVGQKLLLPMAAVAEVIRDVSPVASDSNSQWLYGWLDWRDMKIPLCSFEALVGNSRPELPTPAHAVVLNTLTLGQDLPFFAVLIQNFPSPVRLAEDDQLSAIDINGADKDPGILMQVKIGNQPAIIPEMSHIEENKLSLLKP